MASPIVPTFGWAIVDSNGVATQELQNWMAAITERAEPFVGVGSPEGFVPSETGRFYVDTSAAVGSGIYYKQNDDGENTGWVLRS